MEGDELEIAIQRFKELKKQSYMPRRGRTPEMLRQFHSAQIEMFYIAQKICMLTRPDIQLTLDAVRRKIVEQIELSIKAPIGARVMTQRVNSSALTWSEYQLTPEISSDPTITGNVVLMPLLRQLKESLRAQVSHVITIVRR